MSETLRHRAMRAAALLAACCAAVGSAAAGEGRGRIVFSSDRSGAWRIWMVRIDGSGLRQLTRGDGEFHDVDPAFGPDGKALLFSSTRGGKAGVWLLRLDGSKPKRVCDGDQAEWAPNGRWLALRRGERLLVRVLATGRENPLTPADWTRCSGPAWSPDSKLIAFASLRAGANALYVVPVIGGTPRKVYDKKGACQPHWSPDGKTLAYETETHVCVIRADGTKNRLLTWFGGVQRFPRWSPDGTRLVFCQGPSERGPWELYVIPAVGGTPRKLTTDGSDMYPDWK